MSLRVPCPSVPSADSVGQWPTWMRGGTRAWHHQRVVVVERADERGVVLALYRRGLNPSRRLLTPQEAAHALETGELRPKS